MEQQILKQKCERTLLHLNQRLTLQTLASIRSLITNPHTSNPTLSSLLETLTRSLQAELADSDSLTSYQILTLLADLSHRLPHLSTFLSPSILSSSSRLAAAAAALAVISDYDNRNFVDDRLFLSLCFSPSASVRSWLIRSGERFSVPPHLLFTVCLGFTKDPYPYVREAALDGLVILAKVGVVFEDVDLIRGCYFRGVELLRDDEDCVRCAAVCVVSEWGRMLVACSEEKNRTNCSDAVFIKLCSMVRDMRMKVRLGAFNALGKVGMVSEPILLQTLSKKVLGTTKDKKFHSQSAAECLQISASDAAGAFLHGLEDEFYEVRKSACSSLGSLVTLSEKFAGEALNFMADMLNDDSVTVRLQVLETMHVMAKCEYLKVQDIHMHMFLGTLFDNSAVVRCAARKILKIVRMPNLELFRLIIDSLLENLKIYPLDEADVFSVMYYIGQSHGNFAVSIIKEVSQEIEPDSDDKFGFDTARIAAFLVLAISVPLSCEQNVGSILPSIFSYAATFLGRISHALSDVMNQHLLLAYLSQCSKLSSFPNLEFKGEETPLLEEDDPNQTSTEIRVGIHGQDKVDQASETQSWIHGKLKEIATSYTNCQLEEDDIRRSMNLVLARIKSIWSLVQTGHTNEVLKILRACKHEVLTFQAESLESDGELAFTLEYLQVVKLLTKVWEHFLLTKRLHHYKLGDLELLLGKLDRRLRELRCRFLGLSKEEELHLLELILVTFLLKLHKVNICCYHSTMKKLSSTISHVEFLHQQGSIEPSKFVNELKKSLLENGVSNCDTSGRPFLFNKLLDSFFLRQLMLYGRLRHINAELDVPNNSSENPLIFVPGLPVAIPFVITLYNISSQNRLWLKITMSNKSTQFIFLDPNLLGDCNNVQKFTYIAPFYRTPKVVSFSLRVSIGMECLFEDIHTIKGNGGPKCALVYLCEEKDIFFSVTYRG